MTGYQEIITDPSYRGQIVTLTYPLIGNYGIADIDDESASPQIRGLVIAELCENPSNWRSSETLDAYLARHQILGIQGIDTRALTKHLRSRGAMQACLTTELDAEEAVATAKQAPPMEGSDFVGEVSTTAAYDWNGESRFWQVPNVAKGISDYYADLPPARHRIVAYDFGIKRNILRNLRRAGLDVHVVNSRTPAAEVLAMNPDAVFLSNGPGDPAALNYIHSEIKELFGKVPIFGICLGHQLLAHAFGGQTFKLKFGHRGGNQPVKDLRSGKVAITAQNHGFAVSRDGLSNDVEITHVNLNDDTVAGLRHKSLPIFSVQYHPEAAPGPNDALYFFEEFAKFIDQSKQPA